MRKSLMTLVLLSTTALAAPFTAKQLYAALPADQDAACTAGYQDGKAGSATPKLARYIATLKASGAVRRGTVESALANFYSTCFKEVQASGKRANLPAGRSNLQDVTVRVQVTSPTRVTDAWPAQLVFLNARGKEVSRIDSMGDDADLSEDACDPNTGKCTYKGTFTYDFGDEGPRVTREQILIGVSAQFVLQTPSGKVVLPITFK